MGTILLRWSSFVCAFALAACGAQMLPTSEPSQAGGAGFQGAYLIAKNGRVLDSGGVGLANRNTGEQNTTGTRFRVGSVTKSLTAIALMKLYEQGRLDLDAPLSRYLTDWQSSAVSVRNLMNHTSGIVDVLQYESQFQNVRDSADLYRRILALGSWGRPGSRFAYSNTNYLLLGIMVEKIVGQDFETFLRAAVGMPAGMGASGMQFPLQGLPSGYAGGGGGDPTFPQESNNFPFSAGGLYTTVDSLYRLDQALKAGKILQSQSLAMMMNDSSGGYGLGFMTDGPRPYHPGVIDGYSAIWITSKPGAADETVIVLSNGGRGQTLARRYAEQLVQRYF